MARKDAADPRLRITKTDLKNKVLIEVNGVTPTRRSYMVNSNSASPISPHTCPKIHNTLIKQAAHNIFWLGNTRTTMQFPIKACSLIFSGGDAGAKRNVNGSVRTALSHPSPKTAGVELSNVSPLYVAGRRKTWKMNKRWGGW